MISLSLANFVNCLLDIFPLLFLSPNLQKARKTACKCSVAAMISSDFSRASFEAARQKIETDLVSSPAALLLRLLAVAGMRHPVKRLERLLRFIWPA